MNYSIKLEMNLLNNTPYNRDLVIFTILIYIIIEIVIFNDSIIY